MKRRLACLSIPDFPLQVFLLDHPEWKEEAVVLLDRDEANGRIIALSPQAANLGLGPGMLYGPCLGVHRSLKAGILNESSRNLWRERIEETLLGFSPFAEKAWFHEGSYWLDARGLSPIFPSARPWLQKIYSAVAELGFSCAVALGSTRFGTYAAARYRPSGSINIFPDEDTEDSWLKQVPISCIPLNADTNSLLERLKILSIGDALKLPIEDIHRRLNPHLAKVFAFLRDESRIPLQSLAPAEASEWFSRLDDPIISSDRIFSVGDRLLERSLQHARRHGLYIKALHFRLEGRESGQELEIKPAHPSRSRERLARLLSSRLEYMNLDSPVYELHCRGVFTRPVISQVDLFGQDHQRQEREVQKILNGLQMERGPEAVQVAQVIDNPLPTGRFTLRAWQQGKLGKVNAEQEFSKAAERLFPDRPILARRIALSPKSAGAVGRKSAHVVYSGAWWTRPYHYEMAYAEIRGRTCWLNSNAGGGWNLVGWLD